LDGRGGYCQDAQVGSPSGIVGAIRTGGTYLRASEPPPGSPRSP
jgi:hypothetical protein